MKTNATKIEYGSLFLASYNITSKYVNATHLKKKATVQPRGGLLSFSWEVGQWDELSPFSSPQTSESCIQGDSN